MGIGINYRDHAMETGGWLPEEPVVFLKAADTVSGPSDPLLLRRGGTKMDWEVELGVVIGRTARHLESAAIDQLLARAFHGSSGPQPARP